MFMENYGYYVIVLLFMYHGFGDYKFRHVNVSDSHHKITDNITFDSDLLSYYYHILRYSVTLYFTLFLVFGIISK